MPVTFEMTNWNDTTFEVSNWTNPYPVLDPVMEQAIEQEAYNQTVEAASTGNGELSTGQYAFIAISSWIVALSSAIGSSLIIISVTRRGRKQIRENTLYQFLLGLSIGDVVSSLALFFASVTRPAGDGPLAAGNTFTCHASAFTIIFFTMAGTFYNCWISWHFWRTVRTTRNQQDDRCFQIGCHSSAVIISLLLASAGFAFDVFGTHTFADICYTDPRTMVGKRIGHIRLLLVFILTVAGICFTVSVVRTVRKSLRKSQSYLKKSICSQAPSQMTTSFNGGPPSGRRGGIGASQSTRTMTGFSNRTGGDNLEISCADTIGPHSTDQSTTTNAHSKTTIEASNAATCEDGYSAKDSRAPPPPDFRRNNSFSSNIVDVTPKTEINQSQEVARQALWYTVAYLNTFFPPFLIIIMLNFTDATENKALPQWVFLQWCLVVTIPCQGALNFIVFIRPRYVRWKMHFLREQEDEARRQLQTIHDSSSSKKKRLPSIFFILQKAVLEDVPKRRKRRQLPVSGLTNMSGVSAGRKMSQRVSFATATNEDGVIVANYSMASSDGGSIASIEEEEDPEQPDFCPTPAMASSMMGSMSSTSVEDVVERLSPTQNLTPCGSFEGEDCANNGHGDMEASTDDEHTKVIGMEEAHGSESGMSSTETDTDLNFSSSNMAPNPSTPDPSSPM